MCKEHVPTHTPTPYAIEYVGDKAPGFETERPTVAFVGDYRVVMEDARGYDLHGDDKDDAEFIVRAVNSHDELVAALTEIANSDDIDNALDPERNKRLARAALARATPTTSLKGE